MMFYPSLLTLKIRFIKKLYLFYLSSSRIDLHFSKLAILVLLVFTFLSRNLLKFTITFNSDEIHC